MILLCDEDVGTEYRGPSLLFAAMLGHLLIKVGVATPTLNGLPEQAS